MESKKVMTKGCILERNGRQPRVTNIVCKYWLAGKCNRYPCTFLHSELQRTQGRKWSNLNSNNTWRNPNYARNASNHGAVRLEYKRNGVMASKFEDPDYAKSTPKLGSLSSNCEQKSIITSKCEDSEVIKEIECVELAKNNQNALPKLCEYWVAGNCVHGPNCKDLHSLFYGSGFSLLANLEGHHKVLLVFLLVILVLLLPLALLIISKF